jgi:hypothetical protein
MENEHVRLYVVNGKMVSVFDDNKGDRYMLTAAGRVSPLPHRLPMPKVTIKDLGAKVSVFTNLFKEEDTPYCSELAEWEYSQWSGNLKRKNLTAAEQEVGITAEALADEVKNRMRCPFRLLFIYDALLS